MKKCTYCKREKELTEFNKNKVKKDGYNELCRECSNHFSKEYYLNKKDHHKHQVKLRNTRTRVQSKEFIIEYLLKNPCKDCQITDIRVLEFDHLPEFNKEFNISDMIHNSCSVAKIKKELLKCEVVCANCHRIRTIERKDICYKKSV